MSSRVPTVYMSTDPGAPTVSGLPGSLTTLLDAILVDGYGSGPTAKAGLGWSRAHTDTNVRAYRNSPVLGSGKLLHVDDTGTSAAGAREALVKGFHSWESGAGVNAFPTEAQLAGGLVWGKSSASSSAAKAWVAIGNANSLYLFIAGYSDNLIPWFAGDFLSFKPGDINNYMVSGHSVKNSGNGQKTNALYVTRDTASWVSALGAGNYLASSAETDSLSQLAKLMTNGLSNSSNNAFGSFTGRNYPGLVSGGLDVARCIIGEGNFKERGFMPGCYQPLHTNPLPHLQIAAGAGPGGVDLLPVTYVVGTASQLGQVLFELGVEWQ